MTRIVLGLVIGVAALVAAMSGGAAAADEGIHGLRIENINKNGADFYWSTSVEARGSVEYGYTKLSQLYNPQAPGSQQDVLLTVVPLRVKSEPQLRKAHHIRVDDLNMYYAPIVQYTVKAETNDGDIYTLSGELVLVDTGVIPWWQTWWFAIGMPIVTYAVGLVTKPMLSAIRRRLRSRRARGGGSDRSDS